VACVASFVPEKSEGANNATKDTNSMHLTKVMFLSLSSVFLSNKKTQIYKITAKNPIQSAAG